MTRLLPLALLLVAQPALAVTSCPPLAGLCRRLAALPVLLPSAGGLLPNPARTSEISAALRTAGAAAGDARLFESRVRPVFEALRAQAMARLAPVGGDAGARSLRRYFAALPLRAVHWPRCDRESDPIAVSANGNPPPDVRICPWMGRVDPSAMAFMLGHELGHHLDPCWHEHLGPSAAAALDRLDPQRAAQCERPRDDAAENAFIEVYADRVGAELLAGMVSTLNPPTQPDLRAAALLQHALQPACGRYSPERVELFLAQPALRQALGCGP